MVQKLGSGSKWLTCEFEFENGGLVGSERRDGPLSR